MKQATSPLDLKGISVHLSAWKIEQSGGVISSSGTVHKNLFYSWMARYLKPWNIQTTLLGPLSRHVAILTFTYIHIIAYAWRLNWIFAYKSFGVACYLKEVWHRGDENNNKNYFINPQLKKTQVIWDAKYVLFSSCKNFGHMLFCIFIYWSVDFCKTGVIYVLFFLYVTIWYVELTLNNCYSCGASFI